MFKRMLSIILVVCLMGALLLDTAAISAFAAGTYTTGQYIISEKLGLNIRTGPGIGYKKIGAVSYNTVVEVVAVNGDWGKISSSNAGKSGWIYLKFATKQSEENGSGSATRVMPDSSIYSLTGVVYAIDGVAYRQAKLTKDLGTSTSTSAGTLFWLDMENYIVTDPGTLDKLMDLVLINEIRPNLVSILEGWQSAATGYYDVFTAWTQIGSFGSVMGTSLGVAVGVAATGGINLADVSVEILGTVADPQNVTASAYLAMVRVYATNVINCAAEAITALKKPITSYSDAQYAMNMYALVSANQAALEHLAGEQVREIADSKWHDFTAHYLWELIVGFAGAVVPDMTATQLAWYVTNGSASLLDFAMSTGVREVYQDAYKKSGRYLGNTYPKLHQTMEDLVVFNANQWDALVGTTLASIFNANGDYTKWYGSKNPLTNIDLDGQCTWYAWGRFYEVTGIRLDYANNAYRWLKDSANDKDVVILYGAKSILPKSIAVDTGGKYGHVLYVEKVTYNADGSPKGVYFSEANWDSNGRYDTGRDCVLQKLSFLDFVAQKSPDGYIAAK